MGGTQLKLSVIALFTICFHSFSQKGPKIDNPFLKYEYAEFGVYPIYGQTSNGSPYLHATFNKDTTYTIQFSNIPDRNNPNQALDVTFHGVYDIDGKGNVILMDEHPFESHIISIKEKDKGDYSIVYGFKFKLKDAYTYLTRKRLHAVCDGGCEYEHSER